MGRRIVVICVIAMALLGMLIQPAPADELAEASRQVAAKWKTAVVTVQMVLKLAGDSGADSSAQEMKVEATGSVIDPSGLVAVALSATDPMQAMSSGEGGESSNEIKDTKIILADGQEIPAGIVLRDKELDLAFIKPNDKPAKPLDAMDLSKAAKVEMMDQILCLYRLGTVASRSLAGCLDRVQAVIEKPRTFYAPGIQVMIASLGSPVFAMDGSPVGILTLRSVPGGTDTYGSGMSAMGMMYVVLPASEVLEASKQALEAK